MTITYANITRLYQQQSTLYAAAHQYEHLTLNSHFTCGSINGTWNDDPFLEITSNVAPVPDAIRALIMPGVPQLTTQDAVPQLFETVKQVIADVWQPQAFHVVFASGGYDSRIISSAIRALYREHGKRWLGSGLLFLSNRWEAETFTTVMERQGWPVHCYTAFTDGDPGQHFQRGAQHVWRNAPCPIPGNLWWYLVTWAQEKGWLPLDTSQLQAFTGLWANETWDAWLAPSNPWLTHVRDWYGRNVMAALPVKAQSVEYPLASEPVLALLRQVERSSGKALRAAVADYASPETEGLPNPGLSDCAHPLSRGLREQLEKDFGQTWLGQQGVLDWHCPDSSAFASAWGWWSVANLVDQLYNEGITFSWK